MIIGPLIDSSTLTIYKSMIDVLIIDGAIIDGVTSDDPIDEAMAHIDASMIQECLDISTIQCSNR